MPVENTAAENALATIGAVLWSVQIIPQIIKSHRSKSTHGLSGNLMLIWACATLFLGSYIVTQDLSIPLQIQPQLFGFFSIISWCQCLHYTSGLSKLRAGLVLGASVLFFVGFEVGSVYALRAGEKNGTEAPLLAYGYISAALLALGLLPQYWEIYLLKEVKGISMVFMAVDILGGVFSFTSLFFRPELDIAAFVSYALVVVLDSVVVVLALILNPMAKRRRAREKDEEAVSGMSGIPTPTEHENGMREHEGQTVCLEAGQVGEMKTSTMVNVPVTPSGGDKEIQKQVGGGETSKSQAPTIA